MTIPESKVGTGSTSLSMNRAEFLRALGLGIAGAGGGFALVAREAEADVLESASTAEVYPTGAYPQDFQEVRAAVNGGVGPSGKSYAGGGVVRLKVTTDPMLGPPVAKYFNFGDGTYPDTRSTLEITKDVTIEGELTGPLSVTFPGGRVPDADFTPDRAIIYGGKRPFALRADNLVATRLTVRNIYFAWPTLAAVQVRKCAGLEVSNCVIYEVAWDWTDLGFRAALGVEAAGVGLANPELFGEYRVIGNRIRRLAPTTSPVNYFQADNGVVMNLTDFSGLIAANEISGFAFFGVGVDRNRGPVTVVGNTISRCGYGAFATSGGIGVRGSAVPVIFERNMITGSSCGPAPLWTKNGISVASSNVVVRSNIIEGHVKSDGIQLTTFTPSGSTVTSYATDNVIERNRLMDLLADRSQLYVEAGCDRNRLANDDYGTVQAGGLAGAVVAANDNQFVNEAYHGPYPGVSAVPALPCLWFKPGTVGNAVSAFKYQGPPHGSDLCSEIKDEGTNDVRGMERCDRFAR